jgi:hypothetical protein
MSKPALVFIVVLVWGTMAMATDIAFYIGAPNNTGWYDDLTQSQDVETIIAKTGHLFNDIQKFNDDQFGEFGAWVDKNTNDGEMDILWLNGSMPSVLYPFPNLQPDGSRIELWLDGGNMVINVADWFGYISYEGGYRRTNNLEWGAANILDLSPDIISYRDNTYLSVTPKGRQYLPSLEDTVITYRPVFLPAVEPPWEVAAIFASENGTDDPLTERLADPVVIHNTETGAYVAFINQAGGGPATWIDRGQVCAELIANWVMAGSLEKVVAWNPQPANGSMVDVNAAAVLNWSSGAGVLYHQVYFGSDREEVEQANTQTQTVYRGAQTGTMYPLADPFVMGQTVYWRIDEVDKLGNRHKGPVWNFTVANYLVVDDFESYDDSCNQILYTWLDGPDHAGSPECEKAPFAGNGTGSLVGQGASPEGKRTVVHSGVQSLELTYNNATEPYYSQTERTFSPAQDWTRFDINTLTIWLRGDPGNAVCPLYVGVEDSAQHSKLVSHPNPQAVADSYWRAWDIALSEFAASGVDLEHIQRIMVVIGDRTATEAGGSGKVYLDDIRLTKGGSVVRPVAQWEFEEGTGSTASDSAGWHDGTVVGALWAPGKTGTALWFDGIDDYVDCGTDSLLNPAEMTLTLWICPEPASMTWRSLVAKVGSGNSEVDYSVQMDGRGQVKGLFGDGSVSVFVVGAKTVVGGEWVHLALTRDASELALYMGGGDRRSVAHSIEPRDGGYPLRMGGPAPYRGKIDDVRLYDRALSPAEIEQIAAGRL